jgi:cullin-associated NEDD8-dissociated protein 1
MLSKLIVLTPADVEAHLNLFCKRFNAVLSVKPKESAVKQELEKVQEAMMGVLKSTRELQKAFPGAEASAEHYLWKEYLGRVNKDFKSQLKSIEA